MSAKTTSFGQGPAQRAENPHVDSDGQTLAIHEHAVAVEDDELDRARHPARLDGRYRSLTTGLRSTPMPGISTSTTSPSFMFSVAPSVPIHSTSPG